MNKIKIIGSENPVFTRVALVTESGEELGNIPVSAVTWGFDLHQGEPRVIALLKVESAELVDNELVIDRALPDGVEITAIKIKGE